ncbi:hypothetical protein [Bradyrhizobium sp. LHD-71]|uniref:hypothetical protein n=1 Tax=Bradyrhizobium sp. LHD-71 TaxID=3072141 RepID=UPI00280E5D85|nr:hypothetical protein [Bradyrhizobium sp. LHD-71]MDQ8727435.1 hypothetical protein [Bradyrhizobium sp. LHD-71]
MVRDEHAVLRGNTMCGEIPSDDIGGLRAVGMAAAVSVFLCAVPYASAQTFPSKPITIIVPFSPGGQADVLARRTGQRVGEILKTTVIVQNKSGGNALIGTQLTH